MRTITTLGVILAFALGSVACDRSSDRHAHRDSTGGEHARSAEDRDRAEREHERKGKTEEWEFDEESEELREDTRRGVDEAGDRAEDQAEDVEDYSKEKAGEAEEGLEDSKEESRDVLDNETQRIYNVLD